MYERRFGSVFVLCIYVRKGEENYFLCRLLGATNIWHVLKPTHRPDESHHNYWALFQDRFRTVKLEVMLWPLSDEIWRFCGSRCKLKLVLGLNPFKVTIHNVWICHLKRVKADGTALHSLLRAILCSALVPRIITHTIWQGLIVLSITFNI